MFKSAIMQHTADAQHHFRSEDVKIIAREDDYFKRNQRPWPSALSSPLSTAMRVVTPYPIVGILSSKQPSKSQNHRPLTIPLSLASPPKKELQAVLEQITDLKMMRH